MPQFMPQLWMPQLHTIQYYILDMPQFINIY